MGIQIKPNKKNGDKSEDVKITAFHYFTIL